MGDDRDALAELLQVSKPGQCHLLLHYLYFPKEADARLAACQLRQRGFHAEERLGADGVNWLVLARHHIVPTEATVAATRGLMESLVHAYAGEYDGWEAEV